MAERDWPSYKIISQGRDVMLEIKIATTGSTSFSE